MDLDLRKKMDLRKKNTDGYPSVRYGKLLMSAESNPIEVGSAEYLDFWEKAKSLFLKSGRKTQTILRYLCCGENGLNFAVSLVARTTATGNRVAYCYAQKKHQRRTDKYALPFAATIADYEAMGQRIFYNEHEAAIDRIESENALNYENLMNAYRLKIRQLAELNAQLNAELEATRKIKGG